MSKCGVCGNEKIMCICPKGFGGGSKEQASKEAVIDEAYDNIVNQVANAILKQYVSIYAKRPGELDAFIDNLQAILNDGSAKDLLELLREGFIPTEVEIFSEMFKNLSPNMAMLDALSHHFNLGIFPSPANQLVTGIKQALQVLDGWPPYPDNDGGNFQQLLQSYARYFKKRSPEQQGILTEIFWAQIKKLGTPIIELNPENPSECNTYFLMRKDKLVASKKVPGTKKDLYLQGDFHGYDFTQERQRVRELGDTGIMLKQNSMSKDAIVTYRYVQIEPAFRDLSATQIHGSDKVELPPSRYFPKESEIEKPSKILPVKAEGLEYDSSHIFQQPDTNLMDENTQHRPHYFELNGAERIFRVNPESSKAKLGGQQVNWSTLLSPPSTDAPSKYFKHHQTLYSTLENGLQFADPSSGYQPNAGPDQLRDKESPYADCTRVTHVFTPTSGKIDNVVIINDGMGYLALDAMSTFEQMVEEGNLSKNTAFICITALPALLKTISTDAPGASMPGMGERTIDYEHNIDDYVKFINGSLLPTLEKAGLDLPASPNSRVMIGCSLSGTASIYIASKYPELVGSVIVQSPSPSNRRILKDMVDRYDPLVPRAHILLNCGVFEQPGFAENTNLPFAKELEESLKIPLRVEAHGHQQLAWTDELKHSLPAALEANNLIGNYKLVI